MKTHCFEINADGKVIKGKSYWPDCLNVSMPRFYAWEIIHSLLVQLRSSEITVIFSHCGKLEYDIDNDK